MRRVSFSSCSVTNARSIFVLGDRLAVNLLAQTPIGTSQGILSTIERLSRRPSTMFPDHDNPSTAAAAAPAQDSESEKAKNEGNPAHNGASEVVADVKAAKDDTTAAPVAQAAGDPRTEHAAAPTTEAAGAQSHA